MKDAFLRGGKPTLPRRGVKLTFVMTISGSARAMSDRKVKALQNRIVKTAEACGIKAEVRDLRVRSRILRPGP
jgi:hypothetical protein